MKFIITQPDKEIRKLAMGGIAANGDVFEVTSAYLIKNGEPIFPIMGEFHFSRWSPSEWEASLLKMKAGGIQIVATYVFLIHHEEKEGEWDFTDSRNIQAFLSVCKKVGMPVWLRIGPWAHGECRNGGFPDWLLEKNISLRTNNPMYLDFVRKFWGRLSEQTKGMMCKDGGPILGIQLENEYGHCCGGPTQREEGLLHLKTLKELAKELGFVVPYYTATAWGGAYVLKEETLPVYGGYVDAPWAQHIKEMPASENFLFIPFHNDETIGSDLKETHSEEADTNQSEQEREVPYLTAELGGGLQVTAHRRPYPYPADIEAQSLCMIGAGANLLGYYMYHGGFNPDGRYTTLQESKATGYANDLPIKSYDFQTCIRESGEINESYHRVKKLHLFLQDFGHILAPAKVYLPEHRPTSPEDLETLRTSVRHHHETGQGFLFINNHQRKRRLKAHTNCSFTLQFEGRGHLEICKIDVPQKSCMLIPYGLKMGEAILRRTNASLLCKIGKRYFFYTDQKPFYDLEAKRTDGIELITLSVEEANHAYKFGQRLYIPACTLIEKENKVYALSTNEKEKIVYYEESGAPREIHLTFQPKQMRVSITPKVLYSEVLYKEEVLEGIKKYQITLENQIPRDIEEVFLSIDYKGDRAEMYQNGKLIADWYTTGAPWHLALKRYGYPRQLELIIYPSKEDVYFDLPVQKGCVLNAVTAFCQQLSEVTL